VETYWNSKGISSVDILEQIKKHEATLEVMRKVLILEDRDPYESEISKANSILKEIEYLTDKLPTPTASIKPDPTWENGMPGSDDHNTRSTRKMENEFRSDGEFFQAVAHACTTQGPIDKRLESRAASGMGTGIPSDGGFFVFEDWSNKVLSNIWDNNDLLKRCFRIPVKSNTVKIPRIVETTRTAGNRMGGIRGYWGPVEGGQYTKSKPGLGLLELNVKKLTGLCYATEELLEDQNLLGTILTKGFEDEFSFLIQDAIISGSGAGQKAPC